MNHSLLRGTSTFFFLSAVFAIGCDDGGGSTKPTPDATSDVGGMGGMGGTPVVDMAVDADLRDIAVPCEPACEGNQVCSNGTCTESPDGCATDVDCLGDSRICEGAACVDGCAEAADCAEDPAGPLCIEGRCGQCAADADCFDGLRCVERICTLEGDCTSSRQCGAGQVCVEGDCAAAFSCADPAFPCPDQTVCGDDGECRPLAGAAICEDSGQCALGEVCRTSRPRFCAPCALDEDCAGAQTCDSGRCAEPVECTGEDDCLGNRVCEAGACAQPVCEDDDFAPNGTPDAAASLPGDQTYRGLVSCGTDWFTIELPANTVGTLLLRQRDRNADLTLAAYTSTGVELARSSSNRLNEAVVVGPFAGARPVLVEISQIDALAQASYDLEVTFAERGAACAEDAFEVGGGDDTPDAARRVRGPASEAFDPVSGRACPGDEDWICFELQARERLTISAQVSGPGILVGEVIFDEEVLAEGRWQSGEEPENITNVQGARGTYCLRLVAEDDQVSYVLDMQAVSPEVTALCRVPDVIRLNGEGTGTDEGRVDDEDDLLSPSCATTRANGGEVVYTVEVVAPSLLVARVTGLGRGTLGDPVISLRGTCESANSELACATGFRDPTDPTLPRTNPAELRVPVEAGTYTLVVDGVDVGNRADFRLDVEARRLALEPANDSCEEAIDLPLANDGTGRVAVNLDQAADDVDSCLGPGGPDAVWRLNLPTAARVRVAAAATGEAFSVGAFLTARCGDMMPAACGYGFDQVVPAGEWFLVVDGADANSRGRVEVDVVVEAFADNIANDLCDGAVALRPGQAVAGDTRGAADDYSLVAQNRCTGYDSRGGDVAYVVDLQANQRVFVEAVPTGGWDLSLYVLTDCDRLDSCVTGRDGALTEAVVFTPRAAGQHFIIVDGSNGEGGPFTLRYGPAECARDADCGQRRCGPDFTCIN